MGHCALGFISLTVIAPTCPVSNKVWPGEMVYYTLGFISLTVNALDYTVSNKIWYREMGYSWLPLA